MSLMKTAVFAGVFSAGGLVFGATSAQAQCGGGQGCGTPWAGYAAPSYGTYAPGGGYAPPPSYIAASPGAYTSRTANYGPSGYGGAPSAYREFGTGRNVYLAKPWLQPLR